MRTVVYKCDLCAKTEETEAKREFTPPDGWVNFVFETNSLKDALALTGYAQVCDDCTRKFVYAKTQNLEVTTEAVVDILKVHGSKFKWFQSKFKAWRPGL